jgi:transposase
MADAKTWSNRVTEWRASGESAAAFAAGRGFAPSTLRWWASRLSRGEVELVRVVTSPPATPRESAITIELAGARVLVTSGFDRALLADVLAVLREAHAS